MDASNHQGIYTIHAFTSWAFPDSPSLLHYDANPNGWNIVLSPDLPKITAGSLNALFRSLMASAGLPHIHPADLHWAVHPGEAAILNACPHTMELQEDDHLCASWGAYTERGNSSSVGVLAVLQALRGGEHAE